jgi:hypothetical protein
LSQGDAFCPIKALLIPEAPEDEHLKQRLLSIFLMLSLE